MCENNGEDETLLWVKNCKRKSSQGGKLGCRLSEFQGSRESSLFSSLLGIIIFNVMLTPSSLHCHFHHQKLEMNTEKGTELLFTGTQKSGFEIIFSTRINSACPSFGISGLCVTPAVSRVGVGIVYSRSKDAEIGLLGCNISIEAQCMIIKKHNWCCIEQIHIVRAEKQRNKD